MRHLCLANWELPAKPPVCAAPGRPGSAAPASAQPPPTLPAALLPRTPGKVLSSRRDPMRGIPEKVYRQWVQPLSSERSGGCDRRTPASVLDAHARPGVGLLADGMLPEPAARLTDAGTFDMGLCWRCAPASAPIAAPYAAREHQELALTSQPLAARLHATTPPPRIAAENCQAARSCTQQLLSR